MAANIGDMQAWVRCLGGKGPLKKQKATCSSILAWGITWTEEPGGLESKGSQKGLIQLNN